MSDDIERLNYLAWVECEGSHPIRCIMGDMTSATARIVLEAPIVLPDEFSIFLLPDRTVGRNCTVVLRGQRDYWVALGSRTADPRQKYQHRPYEGPTGNPAQ